MSYTILLSLDTVGASILNIDLYNCTGDTLGNISGCTGNTLTNYTPMLGYSNILKRDFPKYVTVPTGTHFIKAVPSNLNDGGCNLNEIVPIKIQMPATPTPTPTPSPTPTPTNTNTPLPTATPTPLPPSATPTATPLPPSPTPTPLPPSPTPTPLPPSPTPTALPPSATPTDTPAPVYYSLRNCVQDTGTTYYSQALPFGTITGLTGSPPYPRAYGVFPNEPFNANHGYWQVEWYTYTEPDLAHSVYLDQYNINLTGCPNFDPTPEPTPGIGFGIHTGQTYSNSSTVCSTYTNPSQVYMQSTTGYLNADTTPNVGDFFYNTVYCHAGDEFAGNSNWYAVAYSGTIYAIQIGSTGVITGVVTCP